MSYPQGFIQAQRQTAAQPITGLKNPTPFHLISKEQRELRNKISSDGAPGAPPTPNNSYQNTLLSNNFSNTIDPQYLNQQQLQYMNPIKHELAASEIMEDFDQSNAVLSPMTTSCCGSPPNHGFGSPQNNSFENNSFENNSFSSSPNHVYDPTDFSKSYKPTSHLASITFESPGNTSSIYSPNMDNVDYYPDEFPMSAPTSTSAIEVKTNLNNNNNTKVDFRNPHNNLGQVSMSLPVLTNTGTEGWFGTSLDAHSSSLQFPNNDMSMINSGYIDAEESDPQKAAAAFEKRRRRRESHNAVERRRRDNINEKIQELSTLLPDLFVDSANKPNKGVILRKSVDYIRHLKHLFEQERNRNVRLESQVRELSSKPAIDNNNSSSASSRSDLNNSSGGNIYEGSPHASSMGNMG